MSEDTLEIRWQHEQANMEAFAKLKALLVERGMMTQAEVDAMPYYGMDQENYARWIEQLQGSGQGG